MKTKRNYYNCVNVLIVLARNKRCRTQQEVNAKMKPSMDHKHYYNCVFFKFWHCRYRCAFFFFFLPNKDRLSFLSLPLPLFLSCSSLAGTPAYMCHSQRPCVAFVPHWCSNGNSLPSDNKLTMWAPVLHAASHLRTRPAGFVACCLHGSLHGRPRICHVLAHPHIHHIVITLGKKKPGKYNTLSANVS